MDQTKRSIHPTGKIVILNYFKRKQNLLLLACSTDENKEKYIIHQSNIEGISQLKSVELKEKHDTFLLQVVTEARCKSLVLVNPGDMPEEGSSW